MAFDVAVLEKRGLARLDRVRRGTAVLVIRRLTIRTGG